ncbi:PWWP domain-containing DNA repair factor 3A [Ochotona princeps]|uniref:PWWP domain-containing DNA repair factor 3A n=1 Tax=Ochotona princeps TaxID=9978 RepID=UPI002714B3F6|nr:PWWP domain-containing DNA repair factor 3A [Ochotona princeps]
MMDAKFVLCKWEQRLWPAKVLAQTERATKNKRKKEFFLDVQILSLEEKVTVRSTEVEILQKSRIEEIASLLASQSDPPTAALEELTYRRSLRVALDVLDGNSCLSQGEADPCSRLQGPVPGSSGLGSRRRQRIQEEQPGPEEDPECQVDPRQHEVPRVLPAGDSSKNNPSFGNQAMATRTGRNSVPKSGTCHKVPSSFEGSWAAPAPPCLVKEEDPCAKAEGHDPGLPSGSLTTLPALERPGADEPRTKRLCLHSTRHGRARPPQRLAVLQDSLPQPSASTDMTSTPHVGANERPEEDPPPSEESVEFNPVGSISIMEDEDEDEEEEPPRILLFHEPSSFEVGMLVWLKYQKYPFWPAVVKSVRRRDRKASVLFIEGDMNPKGRGITVSLKRLKHFDCKEKQALLNKAKEDFDQAIGWCVSLITDYRVRLGCGSFAGSFLEYYAADISYPVRKSIRQDALGTKFPLLSKGGAEEPVDTSPSGRRPLCRKMLPDRSRAARDRANQKLVEYIVKAKGAESHLRAVLKSRRPSRWLRSFMSSGQHATCMETYLEDEGQLDCVVAYLQGVCQEAGSEALARTNGDRVRFILDVLLPEAIICAIAAVDAVDYKTAEEKYIKGPSPSYREKEMFDHQLLAERDRRRR